jgi:biopolymer transport protein TolQ
MVEQPPLTAEHFGLISTFLHADWVVKLVMAALLLASLLSWGIIIDKAVRFTNLSRQADKFEAEIAAGRSLEDVAQATAGSTETLAVMLNAALAEWKEARARPTLNDTQTALLIQRVDRGLDSIIARETRRVEEGLGTLAIVATSSPFVGLFGTVWGIMTAFQAIAVQRNTNLAVVAPAIAQALFATAIGLAAAIPAYIAYNKFSSDAGRYGGRLESFADDLSAAVTRRLARS